MDGHDILLVNTLAYDFLSNDGHFNFILNLFRFHLCLAYMWWVLGINIMDT